MLFGQTCMTELPFFKQFVKESVYFLLDSTSYLLFYVNLLLNSMMMFSFGLDWQAQRSAPFVLVSYMAARISHQASLSTQKLDFLSF